MLIILVLEISLVSNFIYKAINTDNIKPVKVPIRADL